MSPFVQSDYSPDDLLEMIARWLSPEKVPKRVRIITDTSDFFRVDYDDVVILGDEPYLIRNYEREGRFGIDDEPKFWVKRAINLLNGEIKIIKMVFKERFNAKVGDLMFEFYRSPKKEARILDFVRGHVNFMQGFSVKDTAGNIVRILDYVPGRTFGELVITHSVNHEEYYFNHFLSLFDEYLELVTAIKFLHERREKHGDIRRDHIIKDRTTGKYRWIDFDFNYIHTENEFGYDLFGLGNILVFLVGQGDITVQQLKRTDSSVFHDLDTGDLNIIFGNRVVNLKKIYPYIPDNLNRIMLRFSGSAAVFYEDTGQLMADLVEVRDKHQEITSGKETIA